MAQEKTPKRLAPHATRIIGRLLDETRAKHAPVIRQVERELANRIKRRGLIVLFSDCFDQVKELAHTLRLLRSRHHEVILCHVLAPEELAFSFPQWTRFESLEHAGQSIDLDPASIRREYLARLQTFLGDIQHACREAACDYVPCSTDQPVGRVLADYLRRRAASRK